MFRTHFKALCELLGPGWLATAVEAEWDAMSTHRGPLNG